MRHPRTRHEASQLLQNLYLQRDLLVSQGADLSACLEALAQTEDASAAFLSPCHLCQKPTLFRDAAFDLPFCWDCLQRDYHFWYRQRVYQHGGPVIPSGDSPQKPG